MTESFKDLFSGHAAEYQRYRPQYPSQFFEYLKELAPDHQKAWDAATGNGQGAIGLAQFFDKVFATDASEAQIKNAIVHPKISYSVAKSEESGLESQSVSLVSVFQAFHWFDEKAFFNEVKRVIKPGGLLAIIGYNTAITGLNVVDRVYNEFCFDYLWQKGCWDMARDSLNNNYQDTKFPFNEINAPQFYLSMKWNYADYLSYLNTWSAVKNYQKKHQINPVDKFVKARIESHWQNKDTPIEVRFPMVLRLGFMR